MMKLEMHVHTRYSQDSIMFLSVLYLMCKIKGISCIAITDHNTIKGAVKFKEKFGYRINKKGKRKGIQVIIGEEIMTTCGEIIGLFINEEIKPGMSPDKTIAAIREQGGIVYVPHPYDEKRSKTVMAFEDIKRNRGYIDFIECYNGRNISKEYGVKQNSIADKLKIVKVVGSDAHTIFEVGRNYMEVSEFKNKDEFIMAISKASIITRPCLKICHQLTKVDRVIKFVLKGDFKGLFRIINKKVRRMFEVGGRNRS